MTEKKSTQNFVPIREVRESVVILKDNSMRMVLMVSSLNFALKSEDEQNAIILQYQNFLNSLDFPVQFFIESRKLDINPYLGTLEKAEKEETNDLLKIQIKEYREFIKNFVASTNIVTKTFYVIVTYSTTLLAPKGDNPLGGALSALRSKKSESEQKDIDFAEARTQLQQRVGIIQDGLSRIGLRVVLLNTEELIELYYKLFNPEESESGIIASQMKISQQ